LIWPRSIAKYFVHNVTFEIMSNTPKNPSEFTLENCPFSAKKQDPDILHGREILTKSVSINSADFDSAESVIEISDDSSAETSENDEDWQLFASESDEYAKEHYFEEKRRLEKWFKQTQRKLAMVSEVYVTVKSIRSKNPDQTNDGICQISNRNSVRLELMFRMLEDIHSRIKRRNEKDRTGFIILFDLYNLISNSDCSILMEPLIHAKLCQVLADWMGGETLSTQNFSKLKLFLKGYFMAKNDTIPSILAAWENTELFTEKKMRKIRVNRTYVQTMYFDTLTDLIDKKVALNAEYLPTLIEIGQFSSTKFNAFLEKFAIPFSGPYRKMLNNGEMKIQYFLSSCNSIDPIISGGLPLYGVYEFRLSSLETKSDQAAKFVASLETLPFWLNHVPPLFNESMEFIRKECSILFQSD